MFKIVTDPYVGRLAYFRVYSGTLTAGIRCLQHDARDRRERVSRIMQMHANQREDVHEVCAGDIAAIVA